MNKENYCPDCGVGVGDPHVNECDIERCSICGTQKISCECEDHNAMKSVWTGPWTDIEMQINKEDGFVIVWGDGEEPKHESKSEYKRLPPLDLEKLSAEFRSRQNSSEP